MPRLAELGSRIRATTFSPNSVGMVLTRKVDRTVLGNAQLDTTVLRHTALGDVEPRQNLHACREAPGEGQWRLRDFMQHAVDAVAHAAKLFIGFDMDVRGATIDAVHQQLVYEFDDGRIVDLPLTDSGPLLLASSSPPMSRFSSHRRPTAKSVKLVSAASSILSEARAPAWLHPPTSAQWPRPVLNLISSSPWRLVGSATATYSRCHV